MNPKRLLRTSALAAVAVLAVAGSAEAGPPGTWSQVTAGHGNTMRPGLARTGDGVLHLSWSRDEGDAERLLHSTISPNAKSVSGPTTVFTNTLGGVVPGSDLVVAPDGTLRAFFAGANFLDGHLATTTSDDGGVTWDAPREASRFEPEGKEVYAASNIGAALGKDGTFYSIWDDSSPDGAGYHVGIAHRHFDGELPGNLQSDTNVAVDSVSGRVIAAWNSMDDDKVKVMPIFAKGAPVTIPNSTPYLLHQVGITGRLGAPGVFVAYGRGTNPYMADPSVYRVDTGQATRLTKKDGEKTSIAAAPGGRLWAFWKNEGTVYATRSNHAATNWGKIVSVKAPQKATAIYNLTGDASLGPLDLLVTTETSGGYASWHRRVLPGLSVQTAKNKKAKTVIGVADAGQAVAGAKVAVKKVGSKKTGSNGKTVFALEPGRYKVTVSKTGYATFTKKIRVKK